LTRAKTDNCWTDNSIQQLPSRQVDGGKQCQGRSWETGYGKLLFIKRGNIMAPKKEEGVDWGCILGGKGQDVEGQ
jgi:hypothetical protein